MKEREKEIYYHKRRWQWKSVCKMFSNTNGKRNSRDLAAAAGADDGENFALLANSNATDGGGGGEGEGNASSDHHDHHLNAIELDGSIRTGEYSNIWSMMMLMTILTVLHSRFDNRPLIQFVLQDQMAPIDYGHHIVRSAVRSIEFLIINSLRGPEQNIKIDGTCEFKYL